MIYPRTSIGSRLVLGVGVGEVMTDRVARSTWERDPVDTGPFVPVETGLETGGFQIRSAFLQQVCDYWQAQRRSRRMPCRSDIEPQALMLALPHLFLVDVEHAQELGFTFRVAGSFMEAAFDQPMTRKDLREMKLNGHYDEIVMQYRRAAIEQRPVVSSHQFLNQDGREFDYERLLLPLSVDDDSRADMILGAVCFRAPLPTPRLPFLSPQR